jgi:DDE family transposase
VELTPAVKEYLQGTADALRGAERRLFMARTVRVLGPAGQRRAERELGWNRVTMRKGIHELTTGIRCVEAFCLRGRKRAEAHLPNLLTDIQAIVDGQCQTDPSFQTQRLYTRLTAATVRKQLIEQKGYTAEELPTAETIRCKIHQLGYRLRKVHKCRPKKR